jgi:hypothetical protein
MLRVPIILEALIADERGTQMYRVLAQNELK